MLLLRLMMLLMMRLRLLEALDEVATDQPVPELLADGSQALLLGIQV